MRFYFYLVYLASDEFAWENYADSVDGRLDNRGSCRMPEAKNSEDVIEKHTERRMFLFITIVLFPMVSITLIGGYGLVIWVSQMIWGPPTA